jgi:hypothetical protein
MESELKQELHHFALPEQDPELHQNDSVSQH